MNFDYTRYYAQLHPDTAEHEQQMGERMRRWLVPHLPVDRTVRILDIGCGHGYALIALRELGFNRLEGTDADAGQAARAGARGLSVEHVADTGTWLGSRRETYGVILLMDVLEHVPREAQADLLLAIAASLQPGGRLILTVPNAAASLAGHWRYSDYTHHLSFTPASLDFLLGHAGFRHPEIHAIELLPPGWSARAWAQRFFRLWRRLEYIAEFGRTGGKAVPVTPNLLAVAEKA